MSRKNWILVLIALLTLLSGCSKKENTNAEAKKKYDSSINTVIDMENEMRQEHNKPTLQRKNLGIVVYKNGKYIRLFNNIYQNKEELLYEKQNKDYIRIDTSKENLKKLPVDNSDYSENLGKK